MKSTQKIHVLYLDDEENNLHSFRATFRRDFKIFTTTSPTEAVEILKKEEIHVILSDQKMPSLSGVEFFELILQDYPEPIRMLLTGFADIEAVIDAINKGQIFRYLQKPWNEHDLRITIQNAFEMFTSRRALEQKTRELEKAYDELEKFVYSASHDLRAPLVSVLGILKLAKEEGIPEESANYFSMIETTVGKLDGFVQNIVNYYQNMKKGVLMVDTDLDLLVDGVFGTHRNFEASSSFEFVKEINTANPSYKLDELRMKMVLNNLVSNAIKYQDRTKDKQFININITNSEDNLVITAQDNGVGIDAESQEKVFDMFFRVAEDDMGSGIGLYIVKEAVEKMNGNIHLESTQGVGTTFKITIPLTHE